MRAFLALAVSCFLAECLGIRGAEAQERACPIAGNYSVGFDGCYHRNPQAVLAGCANKRNDCGHKPGREAQQASSPPYTLATPSQVTAALVCDIAAAVRDKHSSVLATALITADITFSVVNKTSKGVALTIGAIPVFTGADIAPSLNLSGLTSVSQVGTTSITVDPAHLQPCDHKSPNKWLTSQVVTELLAEGVKLNQITEQVQFIVTNQSSAGLKLNIVPVAFGPQFSGETDKAQRICILFDFTKTPGKTPDKAQCPSVVSAGGGTGSSSQ